jgi:hypothetical protein
MAGMIVNLEALVDYRGDTLQSPEVCPVAGRQRTFQKHLSQVGLARF